MEHIPHIWKIRGRLHAYLMDESTSLCRFVPACKNSRSMNKTLAPLYKEDNL